MTKKIRENIYHAILTNAGSDVHSIGFKRIEDTNPASIAVKLVNMASEAFIGISDGHDKERRNFFLSVGITLVKLSDLTDNAMKMTVKEIVDQWKLLLNEWEQDDAKQKMITDEIKQKDKQLNSKTQEKEKITDDKDMHEKKCKETIEVLDKYKASEHQLSNVDYIQLVKQIITIMNKK